MCEVKNIKLAEDWTEEEVKLMESTGNHVVNQIYEANIMCSKKKWQLESLKGSQEQTARAKFVEDKYKHQTYFCNKTAARQLMTVTDNEREDEHETKTPSLQSAHGHHPHHNQGGCGYGSNNFMDRLMEKSTAGIAPKSATGKEAWQHLSFRAEGEEGFSNAVVSHDDLGYGEPVDLGYDNHLDDGSSDASAAENEAVLAQKLARKGLVRSGSFRGRRTSIGSVHRSDSSGSLGGGSGEQQRNSNRVVRRSSLGVLANDDDDDVEADEVFVPPTLNKRRMSLGCTSIPTTRRNSIGTRNNYQSPEVAETPKKRSSGRRGSMGSSIVVESSPTTNPSSEDGCPQRRTGRRGSMGGGSKVETADEGKPKHRVGRRGSMGSSHSIESGTKDEERIRRRSGRRGSLGGNQGADGVGEEKVKRRSGRRGSMGSGKSLDSKDESVDCTDEEKPRRRSGRRGSLGSRASIESNDQSVDGADEEKPSRRSGRRGSMGKSTEPKEEERLQRHSGRRGSLGRRGSIGKGASGDQDVDAVGSDPAKLLKKGEGTLPRRRRGSIGTATATSGKTTSPDTKKPNRRRRCSIGGQKNTAQSASLVAC